VSALDDLVALLDLESLEVNLFRGVSRDPSRVRIYGGEVLAQALMAAGRTVGPERRVHSMHAYFLRLGDPKVPIVYDVDRIRDGRSFTTRRVVAIQHGEAIFNLAASFHVPEDGPEHFDRMPDVPSADSIRPLVRLPDDAPETIDRKGAPHVVDALDFRNVGDAWSPPGENRGSAAREPEQDTWLRARGRLPDDPLLHACVVAYASDLTLLGTATLPHPLGEHDAGWMMASLDHVMWFHRPFRADEWLLYHVHSPSAAAARGFAQGQLFQADGTLAVSVAQEGLMRWMR
jgi:acyl-CoA thioesterase-2